jgi:hypothetical protein
VLTADMRTPFKMTISGAKRTASNNGNSVATYTNLR